MRVNWGLLLNEARAVVESYDIPITLRQLFYLLVAALLIPNTRKYYQRLSSYTAEARRAEKDKFPDLIDEGREIIGTGGGDTSPEDALRDALRDVVEYYRRDHTEGQPVSLYLAVEKRGMVSQLTRWFGGRASILGLGGYASQSFCDEVVRDVERQDRPAILIIAVDHDPTGPDILRDFVERTGCWKAVHQVALTPEQVEQYDLPDAFDNDEQTAEKVRKDPRAAKFVERFGRLTQVELDALPPDVLRQLYADAIERYWDDDAYQAVLERERAERAQLERLASEWRPPDGD